MTLNYLDIFRTTYVWSVRLQDPVIRSHYLAKGYRWMRVVHRRWDQMIRQPTIGTILELRTVQQPGMVSLESPQGRAIIGRLCYP